MWATDVPHKLQPAKWMEQRRVNPGDRRAGCNRCSAPRLLFRKLSLGMHYRADRRNSRQIGSARPLKPGSPGKAGQAPPTPASPERAPGFRGTPGSMHDSARVGPPEPGDGAVGEAHDQACLAARQRPPVRIRPDAFHPDPEQLAVEPGDGRRVHRFGPAAVTGASTALSPGARRRDRRPSQPVDHRAPTRLRGTRGLHRIERVAADALFQQRPANPPATSAAMITSASTASGSAIPRCACSRAKRIAERHPGAEREAVHRRRGRDRGRGSAGR